MNGKAGGGLAFGRRVPSALVGAWKVHGADSCSWTAGFLYSEKKRMFMS